MDTIRKEPEDKCLYERMYLPYTVALNKLFTIDEIEHARIRVANFQREFNLEFTAGYGGVLVLRQLIDA